MPKNASEEIVFNMAEKSVVKINNSTSDFEGIVNDANEWQKNVDNILLIRKSVYDIQHGDWVTYNSHDYLVIFEPEDRDFFKSAKMRKCNTSLPLSGEPELVDTGETDWRGDPIYEEVPGEPIYLPCIVESRVNAEGVSEAINLPEGTLLITIPFTEHKDLVRDGSITVYGEPYKIYNVDQTQSLNKTGILIISAKRV